ncbi:MAG: hypothetical protein KC910_24640, partial [Candidatus Eremiobacteraeota bacterium]|nr:hypothetical protein [Candidatus Eremiobacteraeota bacterium]
MGRRGIALVSVLLLASVLLAMMLALYVAVRGDLFFSQAHNQSVAALYAAEAGLADCMIALEGADYNLGGSLTQTLSNGASYTIEFNDTPPFTSTQSVNNLLNPAAPVESYRGPASVPASTALIVVRGRSGGVERVLEAVISRAAGGPQLDAAVQTSGTLQLGGGIDVNGITSMTDATPVPAVLHSNAPSGLGVAWDGSGTANIQ